MPRRNSTAKPARALIALLTDFGYQDWFAGVMKGVIKRLCPQADVVDITHGIAPQDITAGAIALASARDYFPDNTIFLTVVDPGVGSTRQPVIVRIAHQYFVGPNNGLFGLIAKRAPQVCCRIMEPRLVSADPLSATFHGRDIFAPAAALLAAGRPWTSMAPSVTTVESLPLAAPHADGSRVTGEIIHFDHFGNAITCIEPCHTASLRPPLAARAGAGPWLPLCTTYADVPIGRALAYWGSAGFLEIAVNCGDARSQLRLTRGTRVTVRHAGS